LIIVAQYKIGVIVQQNSDQTSIESLINALQTTTEGQELNSIALSFEKYGEMAVVSLINLLQDEAVSLVIKRYVAWALWRIPDNRAVEPLLALLNIHDELTQSAIQTLGRIGDYRATEPLRAFLLNNSNEDLRATAASALGEIRDDYAIDALITALKTDNSAKVRRLAAFALKYYRGEKVIDALIAALGDEATIIPIWARYALDEQGEQARPHLKKVFDENPDLIHRIFNTWPWEWVEPCRQGQNRELQVEFENFLSGFLDNMVSRVEKFATIQEAHRHLAHNCPICGKVADDLSWFFFSTPPETWAALMGRAGWMTVCDDCHLQVDFFGGIMN
jgi:hypothetical protein